MDPFLLCTDLDRTLLPNGKPPESPQARERFARLAQHPALRLAYASGRHLGSVEDAIEGHGLPYPDYAICDVGSSIYQADGEKRDRSIPRKWRALETWRARLQAKWRGGTPAVAQQALASLGQLLLQEPERQTPFKLSYYAPAMQDPRELLAMVQHCLEARALEARLIYSLDEISGTGLLDLLPPGSGKLAAIEHLLEVGGFSRERTLFAGDSGNDLEVLVSSIPSVLVANATDELRSEAVAGARQMENSSRLYLARGGLQAMNGNYAAGILEGMVHYLPESEAWWT